MPEIERDLGQVEIAMNRLSEVITEAQMLFKKTSERLNPILRPVAPTPSDNGGTKIVHQMPAPLASNLNSEIHQIEKLIADMDDINHRIEL